MINWTLMTEEPFNTQFKEKWLKIGLKYGKIGALYPTLPLTLGPRGPSVWEGLGLGCRHTASACPLLSLSLSHSYTHTHTHTHTHTQREGRIIAGHVSLSRGVWNV